MDLTERTTATETAFKGHLISVEVLSVELPDGRRTHREVVRHRPAVAVIARRPDGKFVFVRQYRKPIEEAYLEIIAGGMEAGETPEEAAVRETREETGYGVRSLQFLTTTVCTPGYCDERIHLFFAELEAVVGATDQDDNENVHAELLTEEEVVAAIKNGQLTDAKSLAAWCVWREGC